MSTVERWLFVVEFPDAYEVSSKGRVRTVARTMVRSNGNPFTVQPRIRKTSINCQSGYVQIQVCILGVKTNRLVHRMVAQAFLGPRPDGLEIRHLNDDKTDCQLENLCYGTKSENQKDSVRNGSHSHASKTHCPQGHSYSGKNLYVAPGSGDRMCWSCIRARH